jgi:hypothetical protein
MTACAANPNGEPMVRPPGLTGGTTCSQAGWLWVRIPPGDLL